MLRTLLIASLVVLPSCKKSESTEDKPEPGTTEPTFDCRGRVVSANYQAGSGDHRSRLEIGCDGGPPYIRGTIATKGNDQPMVAKIGAEDFDRVWAALDAAKWTELPKECGAGGDMTLSISLRTAEAKAKYDCKGPITEQHAQLVRALELVAPDKTFKGLEVGTPPPVSALTKLVPGIAADKAAVDKLVEGYEVTETDSAIEEGMRKIKLFTVKKDGKEVAFARGEKGKIFAVRILEDGYPVADGKAVLGQPLAETALIKDCHCQGEDGTDGFHCELEGAKGTLVFETVEGDCSLGEPDQARAAVKGRKAVGFEL